MIGMRVSVSRINSVLIARRMRKGSVQPMRRAAAYIRKTAASSIRRRKKASQPGTPPSTRSGRLKKSILYHLDTTRLVAVIGPRYSTIGRVGSIHEFGGKERRRKPNFKLRIGGHGPVRFATPRDRIRRGNRRGDPQLVVIKIRTAQQLAKARQVAAENEARISARGMKTFPPRPFMGPALTTTRNKLPGYWRGALK